LLQGNIKRFHELCYSLILYTIEHQALATIAFLWRDMNHLFSLIPLLFTTQQHKWQNNDSLIVYILNKFFIWKEQIVYLELVTESFVGVPFLLRQVSEDPTSWQRLLYNKCCELSRIETISFNKKLLDCIFTYEDNQRDTSEISDGDVVVRLDDVADLSIIKLVLREFVMNSLSNLNECFTIFLSVLDRVQLLSYRMKSFIQSLSRENNVLARPMHPLLQSNMTLTISGCSIETYR
jgi:hypothetical protein